MNKKNVVLVDFIPDDSWKFVQEIKKVTNTEWIIKTCDNHEVKRGIVGFLRYYKYFLFPLKVFFERNQYNCICAWQQFYGIILAFYFRIFHTKKRNKLVIMTFIYKKKKGLIGKIYYRFIKYSIDNIYVDHIICFSRKEISYYKDIFNMDDSKFVYCTLGEEDKNAKKEYRTFEEVKDNYILSVGRSNRDYDTLIWNFKNTKHKLSIICDLLDNDKTDNIEIFNDIHGKEYYTAIKNAFCVVICLKDSMISSGQLVLIHSYMFGKPVIIAPDGALSEYIDSGVTALVVDKNEILNAVERLKSDKSLYDRLSVNGRKKYDKIFTIEELARQIAEIVA